MATFNSLTREFEMQKIILCFFLWILWQDLNSGLTFLCHGYQLIVDRRNFLSVQFPPPHLFLFNTLVHQNLNSTIQMFLLFLPFPPTQVVSVNLILPFLILNRPKVTEGSKRGFRKEWGYLKRELLKLPVLTFGSHIDYTFFSSLELH